MTEGMFPRVYIGRGSFSKAKVHGFPMVDLARPDITSVLSDLILTRAEGVLLSDLASRPKLGKTVLLKFMEEFQGKIVVYASSDVVDRVLMSRFMLSEKAEDMEGQEEFLLQMKKMPLLHPVVVRHFPMQRKILGVWDAQL